MTTLRTIWKFPLNDSDRQTISLPLDYRIMSAGLDPDGDLCIWAAVDPDAKRIDVEICIVGTGRAMPRLGDFIGTVLCDRFVWHIFTGPGHGSNFDKAFHYATRMNS